MKEWPKGNQFVSYSLIIDPITKIFRNFFEQTKKVIRDIQYNGYNFGKDSLGTNFSPSEKLTKFQLDYGKDDQGETLLDVLINIIFNLGMEQGRRQEREKFSSQLVQIRFAFRMFAAGIERIDDESRAEEGE